MNYFKTNIIIALALTFKNKQVSTCKQCIEKQEILQIEINKNTKN